MSEERNLYRIQKEIIVYDGGKHTIGSCDYVWAKSERFAIIRAIASEKREVESIRAKHIVSEVNILK